MERIPISVIVPRYFFAHSPIRPEQHMILDFPWLPLDSVMSTAQESVTLSDGRCDPILGGNQ